MSEKTKSNAPWILGIVGIVLTIMHYACAVLCSATMGAMSGVAADGKFDNATADTNFNNSVVIGNTSAVLFIVCFILSFFGKSKYSTITGIVMILCAIIGIILSCAHLSIPGLAAGTLFIIAGGISISNSKRISE